MQSTFDIFRVGIGPSSSHTMGPMRAALRFLDELRAMGLMERVGGVRCDLHGSLALTGKGHMTDRAVLLGLWGVKPEEADPDVIQEFVGLVDRTRRLPLGAFPRLADERSIPFDPERDIAFFPKQLPLHENGLVLHALGPDGTELHSNTYYSIGGGFVVEAARFDAPDGVSGDVPYPYASAEELIAVCAEHGLSISTLVLENERALHPGVDVQAHFEHIWGIMSACMDRGMRTEGILPGGLHVARRAAQLLRVLSSARPLSSDPMQILDWVNVFALAVSEENAAGGRMVTAPTSGACGVVPAVLEYYNRYVRSTTPEDRTRYLLTCGAIGLLFKTNASISGAEVGCQGEVGVACSMAAAGLTELSGRSPRQVTTAAEIAMEHCLGMTCDPIAGLVQVPCIERNAVAAVKAINAAHMAMHRSTPPLISLDEVIATMYQTGKDLSAKYRETSQGGLAAQPRRTAR